MSHHASPDVEDAPPPAYELTQEAWDQKISTAVEESLHITENQTASSSSGVDDDGFEVWDEAAFEAAAARLAQANSSTSPGASSSRPLPTMSNPIPRQASPLPQKIPLPPPIQPLRIAKNSAPPPPPEKERPSWYEEAGLGQAGSGSSSSSSAPVAAPSGRPAPVPSPSLAAPSQSSLQRRPTLPPDFDTATRLDHETAQQPPPFSPTGPSLDGPPYEEVVLAYPRPPNSRSPSPLTSPEVPPAALPTHRPQPHYTPMVAPSSRPETPRASAVSPPPSARPQPHHHATMPLPRPRPGHHAMGPRPTTTYGAANTTIAFDPNSAYAKPTHFKMNGATGTPQYSASSFYSSAVANVINPGAAHSSSHAKPSQGTTHGFAPNVVHRPQPHHAATLGGPPALYQSSQHYPTAAQQYAAQHGHHGHNQSANYQTAQAPNYHGSVDISDASSVYSGHSSQSQGHLYNPTSFGQAFGAQSNGSQYNTGGTYPMSGQQSFQTSYAASTYAQSASAPTTAQTSSFSVQQTSIPPPPPLTAPHRPNLQPPVSHHSQYNSHTPPSSAPANMQTMTSPPTLSPQNSYTPTSYGSSPTGSAQVSPSITSPGQFAQAQTMGYAPTSYGASSAPALAGMSQPAQYQGGYLPPGAAAPAYGGRSNGVTEMATAQTELQTARTDRWTESIELATAGLQLTNTVLGIMNNSNGGNSDSNNYY